MVKRTYAQIIPKPWQRTLLKLDRLERRIINLEASVRANLPVPAGAKVYNDSAVPPRRIGHGAGSVTYTPTRRKDAEG
jgi:hypothetical protein